MKPVEMIRTIYPRLPEIMDEETLASVATLESKERDFITKGGGPRYHYLKALYLKGISYLGYARFMPGNIPRQLRIRLTEELNLPKDLVTIRTIDAGEKSRIVSEVRKFTGIGPYDRTVRAAVESWLKNGVAREEGDLLIVINAAIERLRTIRVELPPFEAISMIAESALIEADKALQDELACLLHPGEREKLNALLQTETKQTPFDYLKNDAPAPCPTGIQTELERIKAFEHYPLAASLLNRLTRRKREHFARIAQRCHASELKQLKPERRLVILQCFLFVRRSELFDSTAESFIRVWKQVCASAKLHANAYRQKQASIQEEHEKVLKDILEFICTSPSDHDLINNIWTYRTKEDYKRLLEEVKAGTSWNECYYNKLGNHYTALRRFLPQWYEVVPLIATTSDDSLLEAIRFLQENAVSDDSALPVTGAPTDFLDPQWKRRSILKHKWDNRIISVKKAPYELGIVEATVQGLETGTVAIKNAHRYAPVTSHLIPREEFLSNYSAYLTKLDCPENAAQYYDPLRNKLSESLSSFDQKYDKVQNEFRVNRNGTLSYCRAPAQNIPHRVEKLAATLHSSIKPITILDVLLDCHRLTGFLDVFRPVMGRQNMSEKERILGLLSALYAYGCNCGPTQAAQATGLRKQTVQYMRRHYTGIKQLTEAASILVDAYTGTSLARKLGDPGIFMTDSMQFPTLQNSLNARHHFRYAAGKSILLYQHITSNCICFFTKALLCDVSEAIHMLDAIMKHRSGLEPIINICDNAGKSDLVFGLALLLNIEIWPRVRGRQNLKLWSASDADVFSHINKAVSGTIQWERIKKNWQDMMWILASITAGKADPSLIIERLSARGKHPAAEGISELGKANRSLYLLRYGMDMNLRKTVMKHTSRRETWNQFARSIFHGFGGLVREKSLEGQDELFWFLTVVQNAIVLWNALALEQSITRAKQSGVTIEDEDLRHILPTMVEHINFVGRFDINLERMPPFKLVETIK